MADSLARQARSNHSPQPSQDSALDQFETPSSPPHDRNAVLPAAPEALVPVSVAMEAAPVEERTLGTKDDVTLAALAASSSSSLPIHGAEGEDELDLDSPSFILVATLRSRITDLTSQVTSLNSKLVTSYTRIGDFEDDLHDAREREEKLKAKIVALEKDKVTWEQEIERGGWVERDHVQGEMQRLMAQAVEDTKSRETAVEAHSQLETEIENLTASLFTEANKMVAVERFARARAEEKMRSLEESGAGMTGLFEELQANLREKVEKLEAAEGEVGDLRRRLTLAAPLREDGEEKEAVDGQVPGALFSDGSHVTTASALASALILSTNGSSTPKVLRHGSTYLPAPRLLTSVLPYHEFLAFITHLRQLRISVLSRPPEYPSSSTTSLSSIGFGTSSHPPPNLSHSIPLSPAQLLAPHLPLSTHLSQPFLKRCIEEDSDPSLRLDLAPGLGFLSRRQVGTAIVDGTLLIEPTYGGASLPTSTCTLCGTGLEKWWNGAAGEEMVVVAAKPVTQMRKAFGSGAWSISSLTGGKKDSSRPSSPSATTSGAETPFAFPAVPHQQIHIFRVNDTSSARYAVCPTYCLPRLRAVCEMWTYVRAMERGLLVEEGFKFVQGRGSISVVEVAQVKEEKPEVPLKDSVEADKVEAKVEEKVVVEEAIQQEKIDEEPPKEVDGEGEEKKEEAEEDNHAEGEGDKIEDDAAVVENADARVEDVEKPVTVVEDAAPATEALADNALAASPAPTLDVSAPPTPNPDAPLPITTPSCSTANLVKPPVPPRSVARTPVLDSPSSFPSRTASLKAGGPPTPPPRHPRNASKAEGVAQGAGIVDGATGWEDRCWSEVVKLKESVFWTRVAAVGPEGTTVPGRVARVE